MKAPFGHDSHEGRICRPSDSTILMNAGIEPRDRILGRNWDKSLKSFPPCSSQSPLQTDSPAPLFVQKWFETGL
jgi:hypothetical protein